jgi:cobalt-zinc-cadmium efflux system outer membrane protein
MYSVQPTSFVRSICISAIVLTFLIGNKAVARQTTAVLQPNESGPAVETASAIRTSSPNRSENRLSNETNPTLARYYDPQQGVSLLDLIRRALDGNGELSAARLDIARARARLRQAGLRPNPTVDFEQTTGRITGSRGESETSIGVSVPLEVYGQRGKRIDLARVELESTEAQVAEHERRLAIEITALYAEALIALRELGITARMNELATQTATFVQVRVNEGDTAPLELNLLQVEVDRLRSRIALVEGRLQTSLLQLKTLAGMTPNDGLRLREELTTASQQTLPTTVESAISLALRTRPDLRLARLNEEIAAAGLRLVRSQSRSDVAAFTRYTVGTSVFDDTPVGVLRDRDKTLTYGVSVGLPFFNRNQGAKLEASLAITQARARREFLETQIRSEVVGAYLRYDAASKALLTFEKGVIGRSEANIRTIRAAYELGEFRVTDLIAEQRRLADSQREFTEALSEQYRAFADLQTAIGAPVIK